MTIIINSWTRNQSSFYPLRKNYTCYFLSPFTLDPLIFIQTYRTTNQPNRPQQKLIITGFEPFSKDNITIYFISLISCINNILLMSIAIFQQEIFQQICINYFKGKNLNFNLSNVIQKLKNGVSLEIILAEEDDVLTNKKLKALDQAFRTHEFRLILQAQQRIRLLIESSYFKDLERMFEPITKNLYLLKFLLKQIANESNENQLLQYYSTICQQEQDICKQILSSDQFLMWSKQSKGSKQIFMKETPQKQRKSIQQELQLIKDNLQIFFGGFKSGNFQSLFNLIMNQKPLEQQLQKLEDIMVAKQFKKLIEMINSNDFQQTKNHIHELKHNQKNDQIQNLKRKELVSLFKDFKVDLTNLFNAIIQQKSLNLMLDDLSDKLKAKQYKKIIQLLDSQKLKQIKASLKSQKQKSIFKKGKQKELIQMTKEIKGFSYKLFQSIINQQSLQQKKQIIKLEDQLTGKQLRIIQQFLNSQKMLSFKKSLKFFGEQQVKNKQVQQRSSLSRTINPLLMDQQQKKAVQYVTLNIMKRKNDFLENNLERNLEQKLEQKLECNQPEQKFEPIQKRQIQLAVQLHNDQLKRQEIKKEETIILDLLDVLKKNQQNILNAEDKRQASNFEDQIDNLDDREDNLNDQEKIKKFFSLANNEHVQKLIRLILQGNDGDQYQNQISKLKKKNGTKKIIKRVCINPNFKQLREKLIKKAKLKRVFTENSKSNEIILSILQSINEQNLLKSLKEMKQKIGLKQFQQKSFLIYSVETQDILEQTILQRSQYRYFLNYFYEKHIPMSCQQFLGGIIDSSLNNYDNILKKYSQEFSQQTYFKMEAQIKTKDFLSFIYKLKIEKFDEKLNQIIQLFKFVKNSERLAQSIFFGIDLQNIVQQTLLSEHFNQLSKLYITLHSPQLKKNLQSLNLKVPQFQEKYIVQKQSKRILYKKGIKLSQIKCDQMFNNPNLIFFQLFKNNLLNDDYQLCDHLVCFQATQEYYVTFLENETIIALPHRQNIEKVKKIIRAKLRIENQIYIQANKNGKLQTLQQKSLLGKCGSKQLLVSYQIIIIFKVGQSDQEIQIKVASNETILELQKKVQNILNTKQQSQKWYMEGNQITQISKNTLQKMHVRQQFVRIQVVEERSLEYYSFDKIIPIQRNQFKDFYIEDDNQTKDIIKKSDFPSIQWSQTFRKICLGYIFSGIKKHSRIQSCLKHIQNLVEQSGKKNLWKPKTFTENCYFNQIYVIYNIIKSSKTQLRTDIFRCLMIHYPIPLMIYGQNGYLSSLYEQHFWIMSKSFNIVSFALNRLDGQGQYIEGKSQLLNIIFETNFQIKTNLHRSCRGGVNIHYNIYQSEDYLVNLIDISNKVDENSIVELMNASNMIIIHTKQSQERYVEQWIKERQVNVPVIIFIRDVKNVFDEIGKSIRKNEKKQNSKKQDIKKYSLVQLSPKALEYFNAQFNQIAKQVQEYVHKSYENELREDFWNFSDFLAKKSGKDYLSLNDILKDLHKTQQDLLRITYSYYQWNALSNDRDLTHQKQNNEMMEKIKEKASKQGITPIIQSIIYFYQNHSQHATQIMSKLRIFVNLVRNELFKDFNRLYTMLKVIDQNCDQSEFSNRKKKIIGILDNINNKKNSLTTQKIKKSIKEFKQIQHIYKHVTNIDQKWKNIFREIIAQFEYQIQPKAFSIQNFWREVIYMLQFNPSYSFQIKKSLIYLSDTIVRLHKKQINNSQNFQIINGDLLQMPSQFLKKVFENHQNKKIMIVGIIGPQSSGKSTLLNFVLGCDFMSSAGRCTKGIYGTYFQISNKQIPNCQAILVLDTQGLFSNYKSEKFKNRSGFDNKLVLFCLKVCDLIIMNTKGDITNQCQKVLANAFDSEIIDNKNLPNIYFVLNCNGGPANIAQTKEIEKTCNQITRLNPAASTVVSVSNSKGMSLAFTYNPRKERSTQISKYMAAKKLPNIAFYKDTNILSNQIFKIFSARGKIRGARTLSQSIDDMALTWATIIRFSILTIHDNRQLKIMQQNIEGWTKIKSQLFQLKSLELKKILFSIEYKDLEKWQKHEIISFKSNIQLEKQNLQSQFNKKSNNTNNRNIIKKAIQNIQSILQSILEDLKRSIAEYRYKLQMKESQQNGLDDIINLVKSIKNRQLQNNIELGEKQKKKQFDNLWKQRIKRMHQHLNRQKMAVDQYRTMELLYNSTLKALYPTKSIYMVEKKQISEIIQLSQKDRDLFNNSLLAKIKKKYQNQTIFQSSNQQPIMNIQKELGDLSYKYLDMSKYFQKKIEKTGIYLKSQDILQSFKLDAISSKIKQKIQKSPSQDKKNIIKDLQHDIHHLTGIRLKQKSISQLLDQKINAIFYRCKSLLGFNRKIDISQDQQNAPKNKKDNSFTIAKNKWYFSFQCDEPKYKKQQFLNKIKILNKCPGFEDEIFKIASSQKCPKSKDGNNQIINKIFKFVLQRSQKILSSNSQISSIKNRIEEQISRTIIEDLERINLMVESKNRLASNLLSKENIIFRAKKECQLESQEKLKQILSKLGSFWDPQILINNYTKKSKSLQDNSLLEIGFIKQKKILVKQQYKSEKILRTYIGKQYQQFLNQIHNSNFKIFIKRELNSQSCFTEIYQFLFHNSKNEKNDLNSKILSLRNKIHQILQMLNKDLRQVSQKVRFDFIIDLHTYGFNLLWHGISKQQWKSKQSLINEFNNTKHKEYERFIMLSSGKPQFQNVAASKLFIQEYIKFLTQQIDSQKKIQALSLSEYYNTKYTREIIQSEVQLFLQKEKDEKVLQKYLLKPEEYIQGILEKEVKNIFLLQLQKYPSVNYEDIIKELWSIVSELHTNISTVEECSIQQVFQISMLSENKYKAFISLFCEIILKNFKPYVSSQDKLGQFKLKQGRKFKINKQCYFKQNVNFLNYISKKQINITNLKIFCSSLISSLKQVNLQLKLTEEEKIQALKNLKIEICKSKCPLCKKSCDIDMFTCPHHTVHKCNFGHQIRAIGGMAVEEVVQGKTVYKASILRCDDLTPDSKFQFNGKFYSWSQFKLAYQSQWNFQISPQQNNLKALYRQLWKKVAPRICKHYSTQDKQILVVEYSEESIKNQTSGSSATKPVHYIFAIDQSGSMRKSQTQALDSLKQTIQLVSNHNQNNNQIISLLKFNSKVTIIFECVAPEQFNKNAISFSGGGTRFSPVFSTFINLIKNNLDKDNVLIFISDGQAQYPNQQIQQLIKLKADQRIKGFNMNYSSILISRIEKPALIMQKITEKLEGTHNLIFEASQIHGCLKQVHFKGKN